MKIDAYSTTPTTEIYKILITPITDSDRTIVAITWFFEDEEYGMHMKAKDVTHGINAVVEAAQDIKKAQIRKSNDTKTND